MPSMLKSRSFWVLRSGWSSMWALICFRTTSICFSIPARIASMDGLAADSAVSSRLFSMFLAHAGRSVAGHCGGRRNGQGCAVKMGQARPSPRSTSARSSRHSWNGSGRCFGGQAGQMLGLIDFRKIWPIVLDRQLKIGCFCGGNRHGKFWQIWQCTNPWHRCG